MLKSILILFRPTDIGSESLKTAIALAQKLDAHLHVLYAHRFANPMLQDPYGNMRGFLDEKTFREIVDKQAAYVDEEKNEARAIFDRTISELGIKYVDSPSADDVPSVSWEHYNENEHEAVLAKGMLQDLIFLGNGALDFEDFDRRTVELALFNSRRPVLLVPTKPKPAIGEKILVGWNGSAQSAAALSSTLPILSKAKSVEVFHIDTGAKLGPSAQDAVDYLSFRGVSANLQEVPRTPPHVGEIILDRAAEIGADLLVMGAYSHSRVREMILGGVTQHILDHALLPVLMVH